MNRGTLISALFVLVLITFDIALSVAHAKNTLTVYKVTKVQQNNRLHMRKWPGPKSHIKASLPFNARNITSTGKKKLVGRAKWIEIKWQDKRGWVNSRYLKKTGIVGTHKSKSRNNAVKTRISKKIRSRNSQSTRQINKKIKTIENRIEMPPQEFGGDRYDQTIDSLDIKTSYVPKKKRSKKLSCSGKIPKPWRMKFNVSSNRMVINLSGKKALNVPLRYNEWASSKKERMNFGGSRGRNLVVDVNLERTNSCRAGLPNGTFRYEIKTTINNNFYSGCCR